MFELALEVSNVVVVVEVWFCARQHDDREGSVHGRAEGEGPAMLSLIRLPELELRLQDV